MSAPPLLQLRGIRKAFAGIQAVRGVDLCLAAGELRGLVGENGAGKSTLMHILSGALPPDAGEILLAGRPVRLRSPSAAQALGIAMIHQELSLVPPLSVAANIFLGHEPGRLGLLAAGRMQARAERLMAQLDTPVDVRTPVEQLPIAVQQLVEVAKALARGAAGATPGGGTRLLIMDEPTSALSEAETARLFEAIRGLGDRGVAVIYISHKLDEIYQLCETVTVMRDGEQIATAPLSEVTPEQLVQWMVGRRLDQLFPKQAAEVGEELLRVSGLTLDAPGGGRRLLDGISLGVRAGEIVGLAGLRGSGAGELLGCLFGRYGRCAAGTVALRGRTVTPASPAAAIRVGLALLTNDRKASGLVLPMSVLHNMTLASLPRLSPGGVLRRGAELRVAAPLARDLALRAPSLQAPVSALSGGNQQKVALAKWLLTGPEVLLLDEPTRGIDVGAKTEVYGLMNRLAAAGKGLLLTTSELPELLAMADRVIVLHRGRISAQFTRAEATGERVLAAAMQEPAHV